MGLHFEVVDDSEVSSLHGKLRSLLDAAYEGDFSDGDWQNSTGGQRVLGWGEGNLIAHASLVKRNVFVDNVLMRVGYLEAVAVHPAHQGLGVGKKLLAVSSQLCAERFELSILSTDLPHYYEGSGWRRFTGESFVSFESGLQRTFDEDEGLMFLTPTGGLFSEPKKFVCFPRIGDHW